MRASRSACDVIVGGGAAGLSLASALIRAGGLSNRILILEPRESYARDRTWCYWAADSGPHDDIVTHRWRKWRVRAHGRESTVGSHRFEYRHVPADSFYTKIVDQISRAPNAELQLGTTVIGVREADDRVLIETNQGQIAAARVFDSRPRAGHSGAADGHVDLQQHFLGWHVKTCTEAFDPDVVTLMDFKKREDALIQFFYVLPFATNEALVEATFISRTPLRDSDYEDQLTSYLGGLTGMTDYKVLWTERGRIPMSTRPAPIKFSPRIYPIGGAAGLVKPSTGYGFLAMQEFSEAMALRLTQNDLPPPPRIRSGLMATLDRIFLAVLDHSPEHAPAIFAGLFQHVEPDALVRFLSDRTRPRDVMAVVNAMPKWPFVRQAVASAPMWLAP